MKKYLIRKPSFIITILLLLLASLGLLAASGYYWYKNVMINPDRLMSDMLDKSLQTSSLYRTVTQQDGQSSIKQSVYASFSPALAAQTVTNLQEVSSIGKTNVTTETIGTKNADYIRYNKLSVEGSSELNGVGNVLDVWGKRESAPESGQEVSFLNDALFVAVPFGNFNNTDRQIVKNEIEEVGLYKIKESSMDYENIRPVMTYTIEVDPQKLVQVLAKYVEVSGATASQQLDPAAYEGAEKIDLKFKVDVLSRQLISIDFLSAGRSEAYRGFNQQRMIATPDKTIGIDELQQRLQAIEQQVQPQQ